MQALFIHPIDDYDFVIHLDAAVLPRYCQNIVSDTAFWSHRGHYTNIPKENGNLTLRPGYDPAQLLFDDLTVSEKPRLSAFTDRNTFSGSIRALRSSFLIRLEEIK